MSKSDLKNDDDRNFIRDELYKPSEYIAYHVGHDQMKVKKHKKEKLG